MDENPEISEQPDEDGYALDRRVVAAVLDAVETGDRLRLIAEMEPLHAADIADLLEQINTPDRRRLIELYGTEVDGEILSEISEGVRADVLSVLHPEVLAEAVRELESDDVVDLIEDLDAPQREAILEHLDEPERAAVAQSLSYPEFSAGRLMQREVVFGPEHWTVGEAIDYMRASEDLPEQFYHIILVNPRHEPVAYVTLGRLMGSPRDVRLAEITEDSFRPFSVDEDEGDVAYAFNQYHMISAPVVDEAGRLVGVITIDDAMSVLDEELEEDILRLAGVGEGELSDSVLQTTWQRLPWLGVNLVTAILASVVIAQFESVIAGLVALAVLMPIVASMGGNAGTQSLTVAVRAIATRDLTASNVWRVIRREVTVGLLNGMLFAVVMGTIGALWFGMPMLGVVIAAAMVVNLVVAGLAGIGIPVVLEKMGIDPALASGAFVTTVTDVVGFFAFLGLAAWVLI